MKTVWIVIDDSDTEGPLGPVPAMLRPYKDRVLTFATDEGCLEYLMKSGWGEGSLVRPTLSPKVGMMNVYMCGAVRLQAMKVEVR